MGRGYGAGAAKTNPSARMVLCSKHSLLMLNKTKRSVARASKFLTGVWTPGGPRVQTHLGDASLAGVHKVGIKPDARLVYV